MSNSWPGGKRHAMEQDEHEVWNSSHYPGTRQLCSICEEPTGKCEEDAFWDIITHLPLCRSCWTEQDEQFSPANIAHKPNQRRNEND